jgi:hypothetical protein
MRREVTRCRHGIITVPDQQRTDKSLRSIRDEVIYSEISIGIIRGLGRELNVSRMRSPGEVKRNPGKIHDRSRISLRSTCPGPRAGIRATLTHHGTW